ncbi:MAG: MBL fold metallo-hydrolase [Deltaproteobacteria bacterium]|nr:MBL fold metallo-hydrolase [Deltaproteobacteria bacterium]
MIAHRLTLEKGRTLLQHRGSASNQYILEDSREDAAYLVDCGMPSDAAGLAEVLEGMPPLKRVVCTHFHVDHVAGWIRLKRRFASARIYFHRAAAPLVEGKAVIPLPGFKAWREVLIPCMRESGYLPALGDILDGGLYGTPFKKGFPGDRVRYFDEGDDVLPGFIAIHTPGHRPDHVAYMHVASGVLICGDFIIVIDGRPLANTFLSSPPDQRASLEKIRTTPGIASVWPGHGRVSPFDGDALRLLQG